VSRRVDLGHSSHAEHALEPPLPAEDFADLPFASEHGEQALDGGLIRFDRRSRGLIEERDRLHERARR
jgi:hypothetical protein